MFTATFDYFRQRTAFPGWAVELLVFFAAFTLVSCIRSSPDYFEAFRADWKRVFYSILSGAKAAVGTLYPANYEYTTLARFAAAVWNGTILEGEPLWVAFWAAYDNLRVYAEDSVIPALIFTIITEVIIMVLARKRMRIEREEGRKEGREEQGNRIWAV